MIYLLLKLRKQETSFIHAVFKLQNRKKIFGYAVENGVNINLKYLETNDVLGCH